MKQIGKLLLSVITVMQMASSASANLCSRNYRELNTSKMERFENAFGTKNPIIGMIHLAGKNKAEILETALRELSRFEKNGVHAAIIENYHGKINHVEMVLKEIKGKFPKLKIGINILPNDYVLAFQLADKYGAKFIQLDYVSGRYEDYGEGVIELDYREFHKYRRAYPDVLVLGGVHPKYYTPIEGSNLVQDLKIAQNRADAIVVTGAGTGKETPFDKILNFRQILGGNFPLVIGAGVTAENAIVQLPIGNGAIVGSYFKDGDTFAPVKPSRVKTFMSAVRAALGEGHENGE